MGRLLSLSRYIVLLAVVNSILLALVIFLAALVRTANLFFQYLPKLNDEKAIKLLAVTSIELADFFLIGTALYIVGVGLYELFIGQIELPEWLTITTLDDLKVKLIAVVVVVLAVNFLGQVSNWDGERDLLGYGGAIAIMIATLTIFSFVRKNQTKDEAEGGKLREVGSAMKEDGEEG